MNRRESILAAVATASLLVYAMACKPAWHPSGKSVAFPFRDGGVGGIAVYDLEAKKVRRLFEEKGENLTMAHCLWTSDGKKLIVVAPGGEKSCRTLQVDPGTGKSTLIAEVKDAESIILTPPILAKDRYLWLGSFSRQGAKPEEGEESFFLRIDLTNNKTKEFFKTDKNGGGYLLYDLGKLGCFYLRGHDQEQKADGADKDGKEPKGVELGSFNPETGETDTLVTLDKDCSGLLAGEPGGNRLAIVNVRTTKTKDGQKEEPCIQLLDRRGKSVKELPLPGTTEQYAGAHMVWVGGNIWLPAQRPAEGGEGAAKEGCGLLRVDVATGKTKYVPLSEGQPDDIGPLSVQPSVSPNGKLLAVTGSLLSKDGGGKRPTALLLLDLTDPDKDPVRIPLPAGKPAAAEEEKEK